MRFSLLPIAEAAGAILGHNIAGDGARRPLRKGVVLEARDLEALTAAGRSTVWVACLEPGDVGEDASAARIAKATAGAGIRRSESRTGRVNLYAEQTGILRIDPQQLATLNALQGVTLATLRRHTMVPAGKMVATLKIIPYALPAAIVAAAEQAAAGLVAMAAPVIQRVGLVLSGAAKTRARTEPGFRDALGLRLRALGAAIERVDFVSLDVDDAVRGLARAITTQRAAGMELIIVAGDTAIMDVHDLAPQAIARAGGVIVAYGAPVDPGNLLLLAYLGEIAILGAPGCARSPKTNVVDRVLPRLLVGDRLQRADIVAFGHGGLLEDVPERRLPRSWVS